MPSCGLSLPACLLLVLFASFGCGDDSGDGSHDAFLANDGRAGEAVWAINLVRASGPSDVQAYLDGGDVDALYAITNQFYAERGDDYDFIYLLAEVGQGSGRFNSAIGPAMPANGLPSRTRDLGWGSDSRLKGVVAMRLGETGNGPTLHETLHYWGVFLDSSFGFGRDRTMSFGPHWGLASVNGQHGGFDGATVECVSPAGTTPPCDGGARFQVSVESFGFAANGGDGLPYAPIELYLMGLLPAAEVPSIDVLREADFLEVGADGRLLFEIGGVDQVRIEDIVAVHGEKPALPPQERAFRSAFILVSEAPASADAMAAAIQWSRVFSGAEPSPNLLSFEAATGGLATMDTRILP